MQVRSKRILTPSIPNVDDIMNGTHAGCRCPVDGFQQMISGKYKLRLIWDLQHGPLRYGELKKNLAALSPGSREITARVLSRELKALAALGLIERTDHGTVPPRVEYALSPLGQSLVPVITVMQAWGMEHLIEVPAGASPVAAG